MVESAEEAAEAAASDDGGHERERWSQVEETAAVANGRGGGGFPKRGEFGSPRNHPGGTFRRWMPVEFLRFRGRGAGFLQ